MGRRTKYDPSKTPGDVEEMAGSGMIDKDIAAALGIGARTFDSWKNRHPELFAALRRGQAPANERVESALYRRAVGYEYEETEVRVDRDGKVVSTKTVVKRVPPDVRAQQYWLSNRVPDRWHNRQQIEHSGELKGPPVLNVIVNPPEDEDADDGEPVQD